MVPTTRTSVALALATYLLASTAVHSLHDHSGCQHACAGACQSAAHLHEHGQSESGESHERPAAPGRCEDSCLACQYLAVKSLPVEPVSVIGRIELLCQVELPRPVFVSAERPRLFLSRAPPCA